MPLPSVLWPFFCQPAASPARVLSAAERERVRDAPGSRDEVRRVLDLGRRSGRGARSPRSPRRTAGRVRVNQRPEPEACSLPVAERLTTMHSWAATRRQRDAPEGERQGEASNEDAHVASSQRRRFDAQRRSGRVPSSRDRCPVSCPDSLARRPRVSPPRPASRARTIASARSRTWSFEKMFDTWLRTVFGESTRCAVISAFDRPCATSSRISRSRSVSSGNAASGTARCGPGEVGHQPPRDGRTEDRVARRHGPHRPDELGSLGALEQVAPRAGLDRGEDRVVVVGHRQHEHRDVGGGVHDPAGRLDPIHAGHRQVHQDDVRMECRDLADGLGSRRRFANDERGPAAVPSTARRPLRNEAWSSAMRIRVSARGSSPGVMRGGPRAPASPPGRDPRNRGRPRNGVPVAGRSRGVAVRRRASRRCPRLRRRASRPAPRRARASTRGRRPARRRTAALARRRRPRARSVSRRSRRTVTRHVVAPAWRTAFVTASTAIRYAATSTAAVSSGSGCGLASTLIVGVPAAPPASRRAACWRDRFDEPELVERRWPQPVDEAAHIGQRHADVAAKLVEQLPRTLGIRPERRGRGLGAQADRGQRRPEAVMQVPPEPTALLLAGDDEPLPRPREIVPQPDRADRGSRLPPEVLEQPQLVAAEAGLTGAHAQHEPSDSLRAVDERHVDAWRRVARRVRPRRVRCRPHRRARAPRTAAAARPRPCRRSRGTHGRVPRPTRARRRADASRAMVRRARRT